MILVKESQMSLSAQVKDSVSEASKLLREAIAFAARSEHPLVLVSLSDLVAKFLIDHGALYPPREKYEIPHQ